jgi:menaquinone-dependent protoporphyrinogen oxidase
VTNVLVAYASKRGSTAEIAEAIADTLRQSGMTVDCIGAGKVDSVESYDAVVLGSAVYIKRWRGDAKHFLRKHGKELSERPFWVFSSVRPETRAGTPTRPG